MNKRTIAQLIHKYILINATTNEFIYEGSTYGVCVEMLTTLPPGTEYLIVAVMREGKTKNKKEGNEQTDRREENK